MGKDTYEKLSDEQIADYYVISPEEAYRGARWQEKRWDESPSIEWCNQTLNKYMSQVKVGELCGILAFSGDAKTTLGLAQSYYTSKQLIYNKQSGTHRVVYCTWDQTAEYLELKLELMIRHERAARKQVDISKIPPLTIAERVALPLWFAGKSAKKHKETNFLVPELTVERVKDVLDVIAKVEEHKIALLVGDYAQRIRTARRTSNRYEVVTLVAELFADFVSVRNVPGILLIQAGGETKKRQNKVPRIEDTQGTTELSKILDLGLGQWIPSNSERLGTAIRVGDDQRVVTVELGLVVANAFKNRNKRANVEFTYPMNLETMQIGDYQHELNA